MLQDLEVLGKEGKNYGCLAFALNSPLVPMFQKATFDIRQSGKEDLLMKRWSGATITSASSIDKTTLTAGQERNTYETTYLITKISIAFFNHFSDYFGPRYVTTVFLHMSDNSLWGDRSLNHCNQSTYDTEMCAMERLDGEEGAEADNQGTFSVAGVDSHVYTHSQGTGETEHSVTYALSV